MKPNLVFTGVYILAAGGVITLLGTFATLPAGIIPVGMGVLALGVLIAIIGTWS